ncbi:hypothetical protein NC651_030405 [Populus alba x Populus x berolinensis]|nr:hypothetical protein NC651_030405 [Populus alba x Populus x berolinensis]
MSKTRHHNVSLKNILSLEIASPSPFIKSEICVPFVKQFIRIFTNQFLTDPPSENSGCGLSGWSGVHMQISSGPSGWGPACLQKAGALGPGTAFLSCLWRQEEGRNLKKASAGLGTLRLDFRREEPLQGKKGTNQDAYDLFGRIFGSRTDAVFCGVFDGHGP